MLPTRGLTLCESAGNLLLTNSVDDSSPESTDNTSVDSQRLPAGYQCTAFITLLPNRAWCTERNQKLHPGQNEINGKHLFTGRPPIKPHTWKTFLSKRKKTVFVVSYFLNFGGGTLFKDLWKHLLISDDVTYRK